MKRFLALTLATISTVSEINFKTRKMKKFFALTLVTVLILILFVINAQPSVSQINQQTATSQIWIEHQKDRPIASPLATVAPKTPINDQLVIYGELTDKPLIGYLAHPTEKDHPLPAVIMIHEWWGLNDNIKSMARRLAGEGYTVLAVDLYQGKVADTPERARELATNARENSVILEDNLRQAYQYLEQQEKSPKIASLGWCFGGSWSLNTAFLFPDQLDATVIYYGGGLVTDSERLEPLKMPILGIFGELDQNPDPATVKEFEQNLAQLGKTAEIYIYPDANHAFANPSGTRYQAEAAEDAWQKTLTFLATYLQAQ